MFSQIRTYCESLTGEFDKISPERKKLLERLSDYIRLKREKKEPADLVYICTHNSRRSHFGQVWAKVASEYYQVAEIRTFSGGTEATAFNVHAINALVRAGFKINPLTAGDNPLYEVRFDNGRPPVECFSKVYDHPMNPGSDFAAIMTCSEAEEYCPFIPGAALRVATTFDDPKAFDNTPLQDAKYDERCRQIAREAMYTFSKV
jgi:arsenate reductase (thioredoxin)